MTSRQAAGLLGVVKKPYPQYIAVAFESGTNGRPLRRDGQLHSRSLQILHYMYYRIIVKTGGRDQQIQLDPCALHPLSILTVTTTMQSFLMFSLDQSRSDAHFDRQETCASPEFL